MKRRRLDGGVVSTDLSEGLEKQFKVRCVNDVDDAGPPKTTYTVHNILRTCLRILYTIIRDYGEWVLQPITCSTSTAPRHCSTALCLDIYYLQSHLGGANDDLLWPKFRFETGKQKQYSAFTDTSSGGGGMISAASQARHLGTHQATRLDGREGGCAAVAPRTSTPSPLSSPSSSPFSSSSTVGVGAGASAGAASPIHPPWKPPHCECMDCGNDCPCHAVAAALSTSIRTGSRGSKTNTRGGKGTGSGASSEALATCVEQPIFECGMDCPCPPWCPNRPSQRGLGQPVEVFRTARMGAVAGDGSRGWGVRARNEIAAGEFVCTYSGEVLSEAECMARYGCDGTCNAALKRDAIDKECIVLTVTKTTTNLFFSFRTFFLTSFLVYFFLSLYITFEPI